MQRGTHLGSNEHLDIGASNEVILLTRDEHSSADLRAGLL